MIRHIRSFTAALALSVLACTAAAQQSAELGGVIQFDGDLPEATRVAVHVVDRDGRWLTELASTTPVAGTFALDVPLPDPAVEELRPFRSGAILLPGLQNEYRVSPDGVNYLQGRVNMYVDNNGNGLWDGNLVDTYFLGIASLESVGFFSLIYVDQDATLTGAGETIELEEGWNVFTVRFPGDTTAYDASASVDDILLDVFLP